MWSTFLRNLTLNATKTIKSVHTINNLGYCVGNGVIKPDMERLRPLQEIPPPISQGSLKRAMGMFAYYAKWIQNFSAKIQPLARVKKFPLNEEALHVFELIKQELEGATLHSVDENVPFEFECDASEVAVSAVLNQSGRPVAFMSRTLQGSKVHYHIIEKEAMAIMEANQRSVAFMLHNRKRTKVKNNKIQGCQKELAAFSYTVSTSSTLTELHGNLCHPGMTCLLHFVRSKNLPFSTEDIKKVCASCRICAKLKLRFYKLQEGTLIKATQPMERLSIDFKGPVLTALCNPYLLIVVDEYSRFPYAFMCPNMNTTTVIKCLEQIFSLCGMPQYIHSDQGTSFMSRKLKTYLAQKGVATSRTTPFHPIGNGQVDRLNSTVCKSLQLALRSQNLPDQHWELVLTDVIHSLRSRLSTATNVTPHERFFGFPRRSSSGGSLPSWLMSSGPILLRRFVRTSKNEPLVDKLS
ncbi:uncharacterized protein LOC135198315 [Macrobrachium nipponense]|uniref:uncharacterized protein LOC135198315 n=1 Tax=Macrobrachium nipponense TaxID=159736 RepID=UPI0030C83526